MNNSYYNKIVFDPARRPDPRTLRELRGAYNVQNCCIASVDFPDHYFQAYHGNGDIVHISMSDRVPYEWNERARNYILALRHERGSDSKRIAFEEMEPEELKAYATAFFDTEPVDGMRVVEYTNSSDGYPVYIISAYKKGDETPEPAYEYEVNFTGKPSEADRAPVEAPQTPAADCCL